MIVFRFVFFFVVAAISQARNPIGLGVIGSLRGLLLGTAVQVDNLRSEIDHGLYNQKLKENYPLIVAENELKPQSIWIGENSYDWTSPDWLLGSLPNTTGWVQQNGMILRGHNLVWALDDVTPDWLLKNETSITPEKAKALLSDYIHAVVGRYRGKIPWWDVVNEAIDDQNNTRPLNIRDGFWFRKLGPDFLKYAFIFAHEADPDVKLYYNEYGIEHLGLKATRTLALIDWLRSEGCTVDGIGLQWHIDVSTTITPGDTHYQSAQVFLDHRLDLMVTELDVSIPTIGGYPLDSQDLQRQSLVYRSLLQYSLYFSPRCRALLTWGFTDRYSWIPSFRNNAAGAALPIDWMYLPKAAYWQMQEELARVLLDGNYRLSPQSQPNQCLGSSNDTTSDTVQLYNEPCQSANQLWNITWFGDGTYRLSPGSDRSRVLTAFNATSSIGAVRMNAWTNTIDEEWLFVPQQSNLFRVVPRTAWWRVMTVYQTSQVAIVDLVSSDPQNWIIKSI